MQTFCQITVILTIMFGLMLNIKHDIEGRKAKPPGEFSDVVVTMIVTALIAMMYYGAGTFDGLFTR